MFEQCPLGVRGWSFAESSATTTEVSLVFAVVVRGRILGALQLIGQWCGEREPAAWVGACCCALQLWWHAGDFGHCRASSIASWRACSTSDFSLAMVMSRPGQAKACST